MKNTALIIIDFQNDYFEDFKEAKFVLKNTIEASSNAALLLERFRKENKKIVHIRHESLSNEAPLFHQNTHGANIHESVNPIQGENIIVKNHANSFLQTNLKQVLDDANIEDVIICGAMSHMCVNSTTRAASELNYTCTVIHDACATLSLEFEGTKVDASLVHASSMASLAFGFASIVSTSDLLNL